MYVAVLVLCVWIGEGDFFMCDHLHSFEAYDTIAECSAARAELRNFYAAEFAREDMTFVLRSFCVGKP